MNPLDRERERERERERDRELEEQHMRERSHLRAQEDEKHHVERDHLERERAQHREALYQAIPQHQNNTGAITIHQPVASRLPAAIHSPGGLLANHGGAPPPSNPLGAQNGPANAFGGPLHGDVARSIQQHNPNAVAQQQQQQQQHQIFGPGIIGHAAAPTSSLGPAAGPSPSFNGPMQAEAAARSIQQMPFNGAMGGNAHPVAAANGAAALGQGQQPILNDALSYLDQVKVQFVDQPDVYNRFLDIMKDFKSQAIDTPGVINRVSELFAGHPNLIQGFNTFLPPGYRIECGTGNDPNTIRVTTPMGTTVQHITGSGRSALPDPVVNGGGSYYPQRAAGNWPQHQQPQHSIESPEAAFSPPTRNGALAYNTQTYESQQAAAAHQQEQRGVHSLQNAVATATGQQPPRNALTPTPGGVNGQQPGMEKRGPVEFNHAISYVNKIKNRFQDKPEIYKQFLEILQTYQRESKPIQDVYAQVTTLFSDATDLLEDFKQFLPESAAQAKAAAKAAEDNAAMNLAGVSQTPQPQNNARADQKFPAVGNFPPPSAGKENKKRNRGLVPPPSIPMSGVGDGNRGSISQIGNANKRTKLSHNARPIVDDAPEVSPTLMPNLPEPMAPASSNASAQRDIAFFDKVKKFLSNKQTYSEFLKLCNLYTQDFIDKGLLVHKLGNFIGTNAELMEYVKNMVAYTGPEEVIENVAKPPTGRVSLSNCRGLGPSYRLLPRRERLKACSGRDEMCYSVLNDDWASHPTWASEDSGFVAHRKNIYEEALHRIEEERHDYDFNIEANAKVIQLLEPIGQQILSMPESELRAFRMPIALGGQSQSIYKRILKKIYGPDRGAEVAKDLFEDPISVLPIVLNRLRQKDEEWRFTQREWEKIWQAQTQQMYPKSLDHMGIHIKQADKKAFAQKTITEAIKSASESQRRQRSLHGHVSKHQYSYDFSDQEVLLDALHIAVFYATNSNQYTSSETDKIINFLERFVVTFFGASEQTVQDRIKDIARSDPEDDADEAPQAELVNGRTKRGNKKGLLRGVLDRPHNGALSRAMKEDSAASGSKESTPDVSSGVEDGEDLPDAPEELSGAESSSERWLARNPSPMAIQGTRPLDPAETELQPDDPFRREWYSMYSNQTLFVFFSLFEILYKRLKALKESETAVLDEIRRDEAHIPAKDLDLIKQRPHFFTPESSCYSQTLGYIEDYLDGRVEELDYQEHLRHYYLQKGWALYTIPDLLKGVCRSANNCSGGDNKDKTSDIVKHFEKDRALDKPTYNSEIVYRKSVEKAIKDGELYLVRFYPRNSSATAQIVFKNDKTFDLTEGERKARWKYYIASYMRPEPTEGVSRDRLQQVVLTHNLPSNLDTDSDNSSSEGGKFGGRKGLKWNEDLDLRICLNTYQIEYKKGGSEYMYDTQMNREVHGKLERSKTHRNEKFAVGCGLNVKWMRGMDKVEVEKINVDFQNWVDNGVLPGTSVEAAPTATAVVEMEG